VGDLRGLRGRLSHRDENDETSTERDQRTQSPEGRPTVTNESCTDPEGEGAADGKPKDLPLEGRVGDERHGNAAGSEGNDAARDRRSANEPSGCSVGYRRRSRRI